MSELRRLRSLVLPKNKTRNDPGPPPQPILLKLTQLRINDAYQRQLSRDSSRLATNIACGFDWELFHLPVVSPIGEVDDVTGLPLYEILDGQHTSIAAVTNGHVKEVWCWPGRANESADTRAESFVKLNTERTNVTPVELFWASVTAENEEALEVVQACLNTGAKVIKRPKPYGDLQVGETICVKPLTNLAKKGGRRYVERVLRICLDLRLAPISQMWILAIEELLFKEHSEHHLSGNPKEVDLKIVSAVERIGIDNLIRTAKLNNAGSVAADRWPIYWWLANFIKKEITSHATGR